MKITLKCKKLFFALCMFGLITMLMVPNLVFAANVENDIQPRWSHLLICDLGVDGGSGSISIYASTLVRNGYYSGVSMQLQKYVESCQCWINVPTYCWDVYSESDFAEIAEDDISVSSGIYRCAVEFTAYTANGLEIESFIANTNETTVR